MMKDGKGSFNKVVREGTFEHRPRLVRKGANGWMVEDTASAKALKQEHSWHI